MSDRSASGSPARNHSRDSSPRKPSYDYDEKRKRSTSRHSSRSASQNNQNGSDRSRSRSVTAKERIVTKSKKSDHSPSRSPDDRRKIKKKSYSRSRSVTRSRSRSNKNSRSRSHSRSRSRSASYYDSYRVHVSDLPSGCSKTRLEETFEKFGKLVEVWLARNPPCFAFIVYKNRRDSEKAIREMDGQHLFGARIRVSWARPRTRGMRPGGNRRARELNLRCYQCGEIGHFSRDCKEVWHQKKGYFRSRASRSVSRSRSPSRERRSRRSRSKSYERPRYRR